MGLAQNTSVARGLQKEQHGSEGFACLNALLVGGITYALSISVSCASSAEREGEG